MARPYVVSRGSGLCWVFLFGERLRLGLVDHRVWDEDIRAEGMSPWPCGNGYRFVHVGSYCFRLRGKPKNLRVPMAASDDSAAQGGAT